MPSLHTMLANAKHSPPKDPNARARRIESLPLTDTGELVYRIPKFDIVPTKRQDNCMRNENGCPPKKTSTETGLEEPNEMTSYRFCAGHAGG